MSYSVVSSVHCKFNCTDTQMFIIIIYTLLHEHCATSRIHTSDNALKLSASNPPDTISSECVCPVRGPAIQQAVWNLLACGIFPLVFSLDQCWEMYSKMRFVYANIIQLSQYPCLHVQYIRVIMVDTPIISSKESCSVLVYLGECEATQCRWPISRGGLD